MLQDLVGVAAAVALHQSKLVCIGEVCMSTSAHTVIVLMYSWLPHN